MSKPAMSVMVLSVKGRSCAFDMTTVVNVLPYQPATPIPGAPLGVHGVVSFNGSPVLVGDLALILGFGVTPVNGRTCLLFIRAGEQHDVIGVLADSVAVLDDAQPADQPDLQERPHQLAPTMIRAADGDLALIDAGAMYAHLIGARAVEAAAQ